MYERVTLPVERRQGEIVNAMTVDVEDYFQVQAFFESVDRDSWDSRELRIERNMDIILSLFEKHETKATFFTLGWVAERLPQVIRAIVDSGHELASHGYDHSRADSQTPEAFRQDIKRTKSILEDTGGQSIVGYRAATFSIGRKNLWAFDVLEEEGHLYSSSINPIAHDLYGMPEAPRFPFRPNASDHFVEIPISTTSIGKTNLPCGGGGYFRLLPYSLFRSLMKRVNQNDGQPCMFYFHPWEVDAQQPRIPNTSFKTKFRHYLNLRRTASRLDRLLSDFKWGRVIDAFPLPPSSTTPSQ